MTDINTIGKRIWDNCFTIAAILAFGGSASIFLYYITIYKQGQIATNCLDCIDGDTTLYHNYSTCHTPGSDCWVRYPLVGDPFPISASLLPLRLMFIIPVALATFIGCTIFATELVGLMSIYLEYYRRLARNYHNISPDIELVQQN